MTAHAPVVQSWPRTATTPAEVYVWCSHGDWEYTSVETIGGGVEPWGESWADHLAELDDAGPDCGESP